MLQGGDHPPGAPGLSRDQGLRKDLDRSRSETRRVEPAPFAPTSLLPLERAERVDRATLDGRSSFDFRASATRPSCPPGTSARRAALREKKAPPVAPWGYGNQCSSRKGTRVGAGPSGRVRTKRPSWTSIRT